MLANHTESLGTGQYIDKLVRLYVSCLPLVELSHTKHASFNNSQSRVPVLFVHYAKHEWIRGSERCLIDMIKNIDASRFEPIVWCDTKLLEATFTSQHITVYRDQFTILGDWEAPRFAINNTRYLCKRGRELIKLHHIQLIHCNSAAPAQWMVSVANQTRTPLVTQLHARYVFSERLRCRITSSDHIVGVSQPIIKQCQGDKGQEPHYHVVANGIDTNRLLAQPTYNLRMAYQLSKNHFVMVSIGSLIHRKGMDLVIKRVIKCINQVLKPLYSSSVMGLKKPT